MKFALIVRRTLATAAALAAFIVNGTAVARHAGAAAPNVTTIEAVHAAVEIERDRHGLPHVRAKNERDAHFGLGFAHAQDRLRQMEFQRRVGSGRLRTPCRRRSPTSTSQSYDQLHAAQYRQVVDFGDPRNSRFVVAPGQSGDPASPHYDDLLGLWQGVDYLPMPVVRKSRGGAFPPNQ